MSQTDPLSVPKFNQASVVKREISANDQSATVRTTLWESKVSEVIKDGVYEVINAQFRVFANGGKCINVNNHSEIKEIVENIEPSQDMLPDLLVHEIKFPPVSITATKYFVCPGCDKSFSAKDVTSGLIVKCPHCNQMAKNDKFLFYYALRLFFDAQVCTNEVRMYRNQVEAYFQNKKTTVPSDENELVIAILSDEITVIVCNSRYTCIGIKA